MGERIVDMEDAGAFCINKRITALKAEVAREHDYACELLAIVMGLGTILGADTSAAECVGTERAARRTVAQVEQLKGYLESLTPGGSEFHNYPVRCREWVEDRLAGVINQVKRRKAAEAEVEQLRGVLTGIRVLAEADLKWDRAGFYTPQIEADALAALEPIPQEDPGDDKKPGLE